MGERTVTGGVVRFVLQRLVSGAVVVWGAATLTFFAVHLVPGDTVAALLGPGTPVTPELRHQILADSGLDDPLPVQYAHSMGDLLSGDLGRSYQLNQPVGDLLSGQVMPTVQLALCALVTALLLAVLAAVVTAGRGRTGRTIASAVELLVVSVPSFWLGIVLLTVFSFHHPFFPAAGADGAAALVLPTLALALPLAGVLAQVIRQELEQADARPFALTARARGLGETRLLLRHTLRHALLPVSTLSGFLLGGLFGGAVLIENIFARPGLGRVLVRAVDSRDLPVVTALVLLSAVAFVVINIVVDLLHPVIDARLREVTP
ncbi:ABC transporter permease [Streptomyces sp. NPDC046465]|uniref:ABC transporter permease n=1 Tax=Streptomyces sp. NPDC046465 TaxID=3155810 RepID=UPI0033E4EE26